MDELFNKQKRCSDAVAAKQPLIGFFWFLKNKNNEVEFVEYSEPLQEVQSEWQGFKVTDLSHEKYWKVYCHACKEMSAYKFDSWPRGRISYDIEGDKFFIVLDRKLSDSGYMDIIKTAFNLNLMEAEKIMVEFDDIHYQSSCDLY